MEMEMDMDQQTETSKPQNPLAAKFPDLKPSLDNLPFMHGTFEEVPAGKGALAIMGEAGDTKLIWDKRNEAEVEAARATFKSLSNKGYRAFQVTGKDGEKGAQMSEFDENAERMIMVPPVAGG